MKDSQLEKMSIKDLKDLRSRIDKLVQAKHDQERNGLRERFKEMAEEAGFHLSDILTPLRGRGRGSSGSAKYVHPDNPSLTWSGRGRMPKWLSEKVKSGVSVETFRA
jgi:DNA-binding protein H-NS